MAQTPSATMKRKIPGNFFCNHFATPPACYRSLSGPFGPEVSRECLSGCLWGPSGPGLRSVQKVSRECSQSVRDTFLTLWEHSRDTFWTPRSPDAPGTLRAQRARAFSCSRPGGGCNNNFVSDGEAADCSFL